MAFFGADTDDFDALEALYKKAPKKFRSVTGRVLNTFAYNTRQEAIKFVHTEMMSRKPGFAKKVLRYEKADFFTPINQQESHTGSIRHPRFSGWIEQETGEQREGRIATLLARGNSKRRQVISDFRLKPGRRFKTPKDYKGRTSTQRAVVMLQHLSRTGYNEPFIVRGHRRMAPGLYRFKGRGRKRGPQMLISFNPIQKRVKKNQWLTKSRERMFKATSVRKVYQKAVYQAFRVWVE